MPRPSRIKSNNKIYHAVVTGINGNNIFLNNDDRLKYFDILKCKSSEKKFYIYAYCLMPNHVHILINEGLLDISSIMKSINTAYAYYFNDKYKRKGNLFHDRYRSEPIDNSALAAIISFINSNPIKAGLVDENELNFIECYNYKNRNKTILSEEEAKQYIMEFLSRQSICLEDIKENRKMRELLIQQLKVQSNLSVMEIAEILNINRGIIQRVRV